jgi:hypothetical protein
VVIIPTWNSLDLFHILTEVKREVKFVLEIWESLTANNNQNEVTEMANANNIIDTKEMTIGMGVTQYGYTDLHPYEIVRIVNDKMIEIKEMKSEKAEPVNPLNFEVGGFSAICTNQFDQRWTITSDETAKPFKIRLNKKGEWQDSHKNRYGVGSARRFYDYNF